MGHRLPREIRKQSIIPFKLNLRIPFSIAAEEKTAIDFFDEASNNDNSDGSKVLKEILFKKLGITNEKELSSLPGMDKVMNDAREIIYKKLNVNRRTNSFSKQMLEGVKNYLGK